MTLRELWRRIVNLVKRDTMADDLRDEMRLHVELRAQANLGAGMNEAAAREAAQRKFGNAGVHRERSRDQWGFDWAEQAIRDFRFAVRRLGQRPAFTIAVVGILALGVGATTAIFSAVDAAMLRPLPFPNARELVVLKRVLVPFDPGTGVQESGPSVDVADVSQMHDAFSNVAVYASGGLNIDDSEHPVRAKAGVVSGTFFTTLGVSPMIGRTIDERDAIQNGPGVVVISYGLWQRQFGGMPVLGKTMSLSTHPFEIVGVMPRGFGFPAESDLWIPMSLPTTFTTFAAFRGFLTSEVVARLAPGELPGAASARLLAAWERKSANSTMRPELRTRITKQVAELKASGALVQLQRYLTGDTRTALLVLLGATALLLLVACANVTNLLLSQAAARKHEIAVRGVLGASRGRIVRQLLIESVVLAAGGTLVGVALAPAALGAMRALLPAQLSGVSPAMIDLRVLGFAAAVALIAGIGFGLW
ncbi:MAG TPA: ABC transporter permease, partial [Gemmatimonadaceae bacterium]|nr:ABC transporter permease [Gemmatimonadaceae bacterium]